MTHQLTQTRLDFPSFNGVGLMLDRVPKYLRFVSTGFGTANAELDALNHLEDEPRDEEYIIAAKLLRTGSVHVDRTVKGRRVGEWYKTADYAVVHPQPAKEILRDTEQWRAWCMEQEAAEKNN